MQVHWTHRGATATLDTMASSEMRVVFLGDIVGSPGRLAVKQLMPTLRERYAADLVIANAENIANGSGLTPSLYDKLCQYGIDGMTLGDHVFKKAQIVNTLERADNLIRPANLSSQTAGRGWMKLQPRDAHGEPRRDLPAVHVITVLGRLMMSQLPSNDPFACVDAFLSQLPQSEPRPIVIVEIHAEASSEKVAVGWHCNRRVAAVVGTHTHIPTADARVLPAQFAEQNNASQTPGATCGGGTAYITDLGMSGPQDSVLGRRVDRVLKQMTTGMYAAFDVAAGNPRVNGVCLSIDVDSGLSTSIERIDLAADPTKPPFVM